MANEWAGTTVVCMASGPSLAPEDVELVRQWRMAGDNRRVVVTNTTFQLAPWADVLYAQDSAWWLKWHREARNEFQGERLTKSPGKTPGATKINNHPSGNSGAGAITLALRRGASRVILLGCDCQYASDGKRHWHGDHPKGMGNCISVPHFYGQFEEVRSHFPDADVVNASRQTAIDFWPRCTLEEALNENDN